MTTSVAAALPLLFGVACLLVYGGLKAQAEQARGQRRFYVIGFYRSVALAFGLVGLMIGVSRLLAFIR